jgi:hypothetical protein
MGYAVRALWKRNKELQDRVRPTNGKQHEEVVALLKQIRFQHTSDGELQKKLNEILEIETSLYEAHLGPNARDPQGRLKWWASTDPIEEMLEKAIVRWEERLEQLRSQYESRISTIQERRLEEARGSGERIDELHEKRVNESQAMVREALTILRDTQTSVARITATMEDLRALVRR